MQSPRRCDSISDIPQTLQTSLYKWVLLRL